MGVAPVGPTSVGVVYVINYIIDLLTLLVEEIVILYESQIIKGYSNKRSDIEFYNIESNSNNLPRENCCGVSALPLRIRSSSRRSGACLWAGCPPAKCPRLWCKKGQLRNPPHKSHQCI